MRQRIAEILSRNSERWNIAYLQRLMNHSDKVGANYDSEINFVVTLDAIERLLFRPFGTETNEAADVQSASLLQSTFGV